jgi:hypothetical protein
LLVIFASFLLLEALGLANLLEKLVSRTILHNEE